MEMHTLTFSDLEWAVILNTYAPDHAVAEIVRSHAQARANVNNSTTKSIIDNPVVDISLKEKRNGKEKTKGVTDATHIPPTLEAVRAHFAERGQSSEMAEAFYDYWVSADWWLVTGKKRMRNWHGAASTWIRNEAKFNADRKAREQMRVRRAQQNVRRPDNYLPPTEEERKRNASLF